MSSTARGAVRSEGDYYRTPAWAIDAVLPHLGDQDCILDPGCGDGAIGEAVHARWPGAVVVGQEIDSGLALRARATRAYDQVHTGDFLAPSAGRLAEDSLIIGNPPYSLAMAFVERAFDLIRATEWRGTVCFLLRLPWLASAGRSDFHRANPADIFVLPKRPSFCWSHTYKVRCEKCGSSVVKRSVPCGEPAAVTGQYWGPCDCGDRLFVSASKTTTSDSCDYAWFCWTLSPRGVVDGGGRWGGRWVVL